MPADYNLGEASDRLDFDDFATDLWPIGGRRLWFGMNPPILFISYSHDSDEHQKRVLALSERLRQDGIETRLDQYVNGAPQQGWPRWMLDQLDAADFVLVVCTETYYRRFRGHEVPGRGRGVDWEGALITQELYDTRSRTLKFVPVIWSVADENWIPEPLRSSSRYHLHSERGYQNLYDFLLAQAGVQPGAIGTIRAKPRLKGTALAFEPSTSNDLAPQSSVALGIWLKKLSFLQAEEAKAGDAEQKFSIQQRIEEVRIKIQELGG